MNYIVPYLSNKVFTVPGVPAKPISNTTADWGLVRCLAGFLFGIQFYEVYRAGWAKRIWQKGWILLAFSAGVLVAMHKSLIVGFFPLISLPVAYN